MPRHPRRRSATGIHHVMNRGVDRQAIFFTTADRLRFGELLADIHERFGVVTLAYCLMGNHFHLVLYDPRGVLSVAMHHLLNCYSHALNALRGRVGHLFGNRFVSVPIESDEHLVCAVRYVHRNPLDIAGVTSSRDYRWSSHPTYVGLRPCPPFVDTALVLGIVGGSSELIAMVEGDAPAPAVTHVDDVVHLVVTGRAVYDLGRDGGITSASIDRTVLVLVARRTPDSGLRRQIEDRLDHPSARAARVAATRAEERLRTDPAIAAVFGWVAAQLAVSDQKAA